MRYAHSLLFAAFAGSLLGAVPAMAQQSASTEQHFVHSVDSPAAPTLALKHQPLAASGAIASEPKDWKAANMAVGEFARGHADVLKWEKAAQTREPMGHAHGGQQ